MDKLKTDYSFEPSIFTVLGICAFGNAVMATAKENHFILSKDTKAFPMAV